MSVHEIKRISLMDVPAKLRELALTFEQRPELETCIAIIGFADGSCEVRGYGARTSGLEATGWLHRGLEVMTAGCAAGVSSLLPEPPKPSSA